MGDLGFALRRSVDGDLARRSRTLRGMGALKFWHLLICAIFVFGVVGIIAAIRVATRRK
jgi:hypothetical protein